MAPVTDRIGCFCVHSVNTGCIQTEQMTWCLGRKSQKWGFIWKLFDFCIYVLVNNNTINNTGRYFTCAVLKGLLLASENESECEKDSAIFFKIITNLSFASGFARCRFTLTLNFDLKRKCDCVSSFPGCIEIYVCLFRNIVDRFH